MKNHYQHKNQTHRETLYRFIGLLGVLVAYFAYLSWKFDIATGGLVSILTWSFFVLCTPVADGGFLIDFPVRLFFGLRMLYSEMIVWTLAITLNILAMSLDPAVYDKTFLTGLFKTILTTPIPYWGIIGLSALGTYLSIHFGDEMLDVAHHRDRVKFHKHGFKFRMILTVGIFALILAGYYQLINALGIDLHEVF